MTSQIGQQIIAMQILPNIYRSKGNQAIKSNVKYFFLQNYAENEAGRIVPDLFLIFKNALYRVKASGQHISFDLFW